MATKFGTDIWIAERAARLEQKLEQAAGLASLRGCRSMVWMGSPGAKLSIAALSINIPHLASIRI